MEEKLISFEVAKLAREKGFKSKSRFYNGNGELVEVPDVPENDYRHTNNIMQRFRYEAPTQLELQKWILEEYNIELEIEIGHYNNFQTPSTVNICIIKINGNNLHDGYYNFFHTYEEALEAGLLEALTLIN